MNDSTSRRARRARLYGVTWTLLPFVLFAAFFVTVARMASAQPVASHTDLSGGAVSAALDHEPVVQAVAAFVVDGDSGEIYYAKDADAERPMASTTKVMTALLAIESKGLDRLVTIGPDAEALARPGSSHMGLTAGERLRLRDLLYGLMLPSGNDAAVAIADEVGGSEAAFVDMMNARARELGLTHTQYVNPHGLDDPGHYTSARDLATLAAYALKSPDFVEIAATPHYSIPATETHKAYELQTGNDLLAGSRSPYPGALGVKPGYTGPAGYTMAFAARRYGHLIVGAVLGDPSWQVRTDDMRALLDWGFARVGVPAAPSPVAWSAPDPNQ